MHENAAKLGGAPCGISESQIRVAHDDHADIPVSIWSGAGNPTGVVLLGHGLGVDRYDSTVMQPTKLLVQEHGAVVIVPEIPLHGVRDESPDDPLGIVDRWQAFWISGGVRLICDEFLSLLKYCEKSFGSLPISYLPHLFHSEAQ